MKTHRTIAALCFATLASTFVAGCAVDGTDGPGNTEDENLGSTSEALSSSPNSVDIGQGFDGTASRAKAQMCLNAERREVGGSSSTISLSYTNDWRSIETSLGLDVEASYGIYSAAASFRRQTQEDSLSVSYVFGGTTSFKDVTVGNYTISPMVRGITDPRDWTQVCGDAYVSKMSRGASLYTAMKFSFQSQEEKTQFKASFGIAGGFSAKAALELAQKTSQKNLSIQISAVQVGGDAAALSKALSGMDAGTCSTTDPNACFGYLTSLQSYASNVFPKQFLDKNGNPLRGADLDAVTATTSYELTSWKEIVVPNVPKLRDLNAPSGLLLSKMQSEFSKQATVRAIDLLPVAPERGADMKAKQHTLLESTGYVVQQNVDALNVAWNACYPTAKAGCDAAVKTAVAAQKPVSKENLVPWFDARRPDGRPVNPEQFKFDRIDFRGDGHTDYCGVEGTKVICQLGIGLGFEEKASIRFDHGDSSIPYRPYAWQSLRTNGSKDLALCAPTSPSNTTVDCVAIVNGQPDGFLRIHKRSDGKYDTFAPVKSPRNVSGIDPAKLYEGAAVIIDARAPGWWKH